MPRHNTTTVVVQEVQNGRTVRCNHQWWNIAGFLYKEEEAAKNLQRKMTEDYYWIGVQENIGMLRKS